GAGWGTGERGRGAGRRSAGGRPPATSTMGSRSTRVCHAFVTAPQYDVTRDALRLYEIDWSQTRPSPHGSAAPSATTTAAPAAYATSRGRRRDRSRSATASAAGPASALTTMAAPSNAPATTARPLVGSCW